jgi:transposase
MTQPTFFGDDASLPPTPPNPAPLGTPRLRSVQRHQSELRCASLDQLLPPDHEVRVLWDYVDGLELSPLLRSIKAVAGQAGRDANDPRVLFALWLYAIFKGIGSARELDRLTPEHLAYPWLCGGRTVKYHSLADFRVNQLDVLDQLLTDSVATLLHEGLVELQRVAPEGLKVRASAGAASFRREPSLQACLQEAQQQVAAVQEPGDDASRRQQAARQRSAEERVLRVQHALAERPQLLELRQQPQQDKGIQFQAEQLRTSTTDPEARRLKMADGGTRPAYHVQFATTTGSGLIVGVDVTTAGGDGGQLASMLSQLQERYQQVPAEMLVDGGFTTLADIETAHTQGVQVYGPLKEEAQQLADGKDPYQPKKKDGPGVAAWRQRMGTATAKTIYRERAATAEGTNAGRGTVACIRYGSGARAKCWRGRLLARALLYALVHNLLRAQALRPATGESKPHC